MLFYLLHIRLMHLARHVTYMLYAVEPDLQQPIPFSPAQNTATTFWLSTRVHSCQPLTRPF